MAKNKQPVRVAMHLQSEGKSGRIMDMIKISNSYARNNTQGLINTSDILYIEPNKNRTDNWLRAFGLQLPVGLTNYGSIDTVTYYEDSVKETDKGKTAFEDALERANKKGMKFSVSVDSLGNELSSEQVKFFENAKTRNEEGQLKPFYHGIGRADRVGYHFKAERATSGPMAFFTDNRQIADNYARDKADTSLEYDEMYDD